MGTVLKYTAIVGVAACFSIGCGRTKKHDDNRAEDHPQGGGTTETCAEDKVARCDDVRNHIRELEDQRDQASAKNDTRSLSLLLVELNHQRELLDLLTKREDSDEKLAALESRYQQIKTLVEAQLNSAPGPVQGGNNNGNNGNGSNGNNGNGTTNNGNNNNGNGQTGEQPKLPTLVYRPEEIEAVNKVTHDFGELFIAESAATELKLGAMPWAGYWYPYSNRLAFEGDDAPLVKLDKALAKLGRPAEVAATEARAQPIQFESWEGHCAAWAVAAVTSKEPSAPVTFQEQTFSISDQKLLLIKTRELWPTTTYGSPYRGIETDGIGQDLRPEAFHQIFVTMLGERHLPFVIDRDPGPEVWSVPVDRVRWVIKKEPEKANSYLVQAQVLFTTFREIFDDATKDQVTSGSDRHQIVFDYRLFVDPAQVRDGKFKVIAGEWIQGEKDPITGHLNDSRVAHPDVIIVPKLDAQAASFNAEVTKNLDVIGQIVGQ